MKKYRLIDYDFKENELFSYICVQNYETLNVRNIKVFTSNLARVLKAFENHNSDLKENLKNGVGINIYCSFVKVVRNEKEYFNLSDCYIDM